MRAFCWFCWGICVSSFCLYPPGHNQFRKEHSSNQCGALLLAEVLLSEPSSTLEGGIFVRRSSAFFEFGRVSLCNMEEPQRRELASQDMRQMESKHARSPKTQKCGRVALCKLGAPDKAGRVRLVSIYTQRIFKPVKTRVGTSPRSKATSGQLVRTTHTHSVFIPACINPRN